MSVESVQVTNTYPHADSRYENVEATVRFAVDPEYLANESIADLKLAPRDADGLVRFDADLRLTRPVGGGNGKLLFVVPNRGVPTNAPWLKGGFLLDRGWTIASCGWQWDVQRGPAILGLTAPELTSSPASCAWSGGRTPPTPSTGSASPPPRSSPSPAPTCCSTSPTTRPSTSTTRRQC